MGREADTRVYSHVAFGFCILFAALEFLELLDVGPLHYFVNMWNLMDWINFLICGTMWFKINALFAAEAERSCSALCASVGYCDDWEVMDIYRNIKMYLSW